MLFMLSIIIASNAVLVSYDWPAIVPAHSPHSDRADGLHIKYAGVLWVHEGQVLVIKVHVQVLALDQRQPGVTVIFLTWEIS